MNNLPNYPVVVSSEDVYYVTNGYIEMLDPTCGECGAEVMTWGVVCDSCLECVPEETPGVALLELFAIFVIAAIAFEIIRAVTL